MATRDFIGLARQYQASVLDGTTPACKWTRLACVRNRRDVDRAEKNDPVFPYRFDGEKAHRICEFAELLPHIKGRFARIVGQDDEGRAVWATIRLEPWQCWWFTTLFGWVRRGGEKDGMRRFRIALQLVPRKNAKSTMAAIVVLYMLTADGEGGAECYSAATTRDQAKTIAEIAWEMARRSPQFRETFGVRLGAKTSLSLTVPATAGKFLPLSADAHTLDSLNVSLAAIDELHAHKTAGVWWVLDTATGARDQSLLLATTTAGVDLGGICYDQVQYLHKILEGVFVDDNYFGIEYTIDEGDDWRTEASLRKANPNYGVSVQPDDLARKVRAAQHTPAATNNILTKHCNVWVRAAKGWHPMAEWIACGDPTLRIEDFRGVPCWIGVDLAEVRDIAAVVILFRPDLERYVVFGRYYLPSAAVEGSPVAQMAGWVHEGYLIETEGNQADYQQIEDGIVEWCDLFAVREIDFDRALAQQMGQNLKRHLTPRMGRDAAERFVVTVDQNVQTMNPAMQATAGLTLAGKFRHDGNPVLSWMFSNVEAVPNHKGEVYPRKAGGKDSPNKIDGAVALYTAFSRASQAVLETPKRRPVKLWTPGDGFAPAVVPQETHAPA